MLNIFNLIGRCINPSLEPLLIYCQRIKKQGGLLYEAAARNWVWVESGQDTEPKLMSIAMKGGFRPASLQPCAIGPLGNSM